MLDRVKQMVAGWALAQAMRSLFTGVGASDPATYAVVLAVLAGSAFIATYVPARRVLSIDPATVLKRE